MWYGNPSGRQAAQIAQHRLDAIGEIVPKQTHTESKITTTTKL